MESDAWGQLVSLTDIETDPIMLNNSSFTLGRGKDCDLSYDNNKLVSSKHCCIQREEDGTVWLCDSSTNGTLLNLKVKITKGNKKELNHGDEFYVVYKKGEEEKNIGFIYQSMEELAKETSVSESEATQEYETDGNIMDATVADIDVNILEEEDDKPETSRKRQKESDEKDKDEPHKKVVKTDEKETNINKADNTSCDSTAVTSSDTNKSKEEISQEEKSKLKSDEKTKAADVPVIDEIEETLLCTICQELLYNCVSLQPCMHSYCAGCYSDWMKKSNECPTCRMKVKRINKNYIVNNLIEAYLKEHPEKKRPEEDLKELDAKNKITKDMLTPTAQHSYDADEDEEEDYTDSDEHEDNPFVEERRAAGLGYIPPPAPAPTLFGFGTPLFGAPMFGTRQAATKCRQCPGYVPPPTVPAPAPGILTTALNAVGTVLGINKGDNQTAGPATDQKNDTGNDVNEEGAGPSTAAKKEEEVDPELKDKKIMPTPPAFTCNIVNQNHVLCQCCLQPMPDRRLQSMDGTGTVPPQQCAICYRAYCHAYWGCTKNECMGCIGKFKDLNFGKKCLNNLILENIYESEIFKNYLEAKGITVKKVLRDSLAKLDSGQYTCTDKGRIHTLNANTAMCYTCGLRIFKELAYQYRRDIPLDDLPEEVKTRENCYWGKNCRTQRTRPHHAQKFSHICDQTRTT